MTGEAYCSWHCQPRCLRELEKTFVAAAAAVHELALEHKTAAFASAVAASAVVVVVAAAFAEVAVDSET